MDDICLRNAERLTAMEESTKSAHRRIDALEQQIKATNALATSVAAMATEMGYMKESLKSIDGRLDLIEAVPAKRWESIVVQIISLLVAAATGYFLSKL